LIRNLSPIKYYTSRLSCPNPLTRISSNTKNTETAQTPSNSAKSSEMKNEALEANFISKESSEKVEIESEHLEPGMNMLAVL
jgi:hypothetical protein